MIQRELIYKGLKVGFLLMCVLFRILLGRDKDVEHSTNKARFDQKNIKIIKDAELIKDITSDFILNKNTVYIP